MLKWMCGGCDTVWHGLPLRVLVKKILEYKGGLVI